MMWAPVFSLGVMLWAPVFSLGHLSCCGLRSLVWDACHAVGSGL